MQIRKAAIGSVLMGVSACMSATLVGCGSNDTAEATETDLVSASPQMLKNESHYRLLAEVSLPGRTIKFFEPEEGVLLEIERGDSSAADLSPEERDLTGSALYEYLTNSYAPQALRNAERRAKGSKSTSDAQEDENVVSATAESQPGPSGDRVRTSEKIQKTNWDDHGTSYSYFRSKFCTPTDRYREWFDTNQNSGFSDSGINMMQAGVYSYDGYIWYHGTYSGGGLFWETWIQPGVWIGWRVTSGVNRTANSSVTDDGSAFYDHCINFHY